MKGTQIMARVMEETLLTRSTSVQNTKSPEAGTSPSPEPSARGSNETSATVPVPKFLLNFPIDFEWRSAHC